MALALVVLCAAALLPARAAEAPRRAVQDPYYGSALFDFFQEQYFSSLADLMVSEHFGRIPHHAEDAEILRGGLYLSYGLHREAAAIFTRLIDQGAPADVRDRAWYFLAKIRYQRAMPQQAEEALARVKDKLPPELEEDRLLLQANLLMGRGEFGEAAKVLGPLVANEEAGLYTRFNLGVALIKSGAVSKGSQVLDEVGVEPSTSEEMRSLRDKANVALGIAALQTKDTERARVYLERVRLSGMMASRALLGFGWAADAAGDPKKALVFWDELASRDGADPAVMEAKLAVPYALAELGAQGPALDYYGRAIAAFEKEDNALEESAAAVRSGQLLDGLLARNPGDQMGWFWSADQLPDLPHAAQLSTVLASNAFQEALKGYRDLQFLSRNLREWNEKLDVLEDMLANRRQAFADRLPMVQLQEREQHIAELRKRFEAVHGELDLAEQLADGKAFADARDRDLAKRLERVRAIIERTATEPDPDIRAARERYAHVAGAYEWQIAQQFPVRLWEAKKDFRQLASALEESGLRSGRLAKAQREEPARFDALAARIEELRHRVQLQLPRVAELAVLQRQVAQDLAVAELQMQRERIAAYTNQARFAIAQIYDHAKVGKEGVVAPAGDSTPAKPTAAPIAAPAALAAPPPPATVPPEPADASHAPH